MTRFDAATPADRRDLYRDAIVAHRERAAGVLTLEADVASLGGDGPDPELGVPWIQYEAAVRTEQRDGVRNEHPEPLVSLDCTDAELERVKELLREYPAFTVDELIRPEDAEGTNARLRGRADAERFARLFEDVFRRVYDLPEDARIWVASI